MLVENKIAIIKFIKLHAQARIPMAEWVEKTEAAQWENLINVKQTFNSADYKKPFIIFNVGGNKYRILAEVSYSTKIVRIAKVGTHEEYNKWQL